MPTEFQVLSFTSPQAILKVMTLLQITYNFRLQKQNARISGLMQAFFK